MSADSPIPLKDQKGKQSFSTEVFSGAAFVFSFEFSLLLKKFFCTIFLLSRILDFLKMCFQLVNAEKQLWASIHSKGLLHSDTRELYQKVRSSYVKSILNEHETEQPQNVEYSLWKLHYKHIDEFRKRIRQNSANGESKKPTMPQNFANMENSSDNYLEGFKLFLSEATEFYQDLIKKVRRCNGLPEEPLFYRKSGICSSVLPTKMRKCQFSCHRFFVCLGDLARYKELYEKPDFESRNWAVAATYYLEATMIWPDSGNPQNQVFKTHFYN